MYDVFQFALPNLGDNADEPWLKDLWMFGGVCSEPMAVGAGMYAVKYGQELELGYSRWSVEMQSTGCVFRYAGHGRLDRHLLENPPEVILLYVRQIQIPRSVLLAKKLISELLDRILGSIWWYRYVNIKLHVGGFCFAAKAIGWGTEARSRQYALKLNIIQVQTEECRV